MSPRPEQRTGTPNLADRGVHGGAERFLIEAISVLHANGAESDRAERRTRQLARALGLNARVDLGWSWSHFAFESEAGDYDVRGSGAVPDHLDLNRVQAVDLIINDLDSGTLDLAGAWERLRSAATLPPARVGVFAAACVTGGCGLAVVFGVHEVTTLALIAVCCAVGAVIRRGLGKRGMNVYVQAAAAAVLAGLCVSAANGLGADSALGVAALCPCLILVPGPHLLKGSLDIATLRIPLGASRLLFASALMTAVTAGLLLGLWLGRAQLTTDPGARSVPIWIDVPTAGLLAVAYGVFYAVPPRVLIWPFVVGAAAHALRWTVVHQWTAQPWVGAGLACLFVGLVLVPVCERWQLPFAALGFASVVSLVPGVLIFRALAGFAQLSSTSGVTSQRLLVQTAESASSAALVLLAMPLGFLIADAAWSRYRGLDSTPRATNLRIGSST
jgi:uncharacterized membrane protein YjjP (DUF1212 family)